MKLYMKKRNDRFDATSEHNIVQKNIVFKSSTAGISLPEIVQMYRVSGRTRQVRS